MYAIRSYYATADPLAEQLAQRLAALRQQYQHKAPLRLLFQLWTPPLTIV